MPTKKVKPTDHATPVLRKPKRKDGDKISITCSVTTQMQTSSAWSTATTLQAITASWNTASDAIEANAKVIKDLRLELAAAEAAQRELRRDWKTVTRQVLAAVGSVCQGSVDLVHALGFDVFTNAALGPLPAPAGLTTSPGEALGEAVFSWKRGIARHGFIVQHATDVADASTLSALLPCTRSKFTLENAPSSSVVHFRVAAIDPTSPTGQGPWSDWVAGTVR